MTKAINYFLNECDGIEAIADYGGVSWDNNLVERTNRYISLSRHNSLFFGSHAIAETLTSRGRLGPTRTQQPTTRANSYRVGAKCSIDAIRALPEAHNYKMFSDFFVS